MNDGVLGALELALEGKAVRRVRTAEGARHYGQPIGSVIRPGGGVVGALERVAGAGGRAAGRAGGTKPRRPSWWESGVGSAHDELRAALPKLRADLSPAFRKKFDAARAALPENPADWYDKAALGAWDRSWRRMSGGPGHRALAVESSIRAVGKLVDDEAIRRAKAGGFPPPLTQRQRTRIRNERDKLYVAYDEAKWELMDPTAERLFGKGWSQLDGAEVKQVIAQIHAERPDLATQRARIDELLERLITSGGTQYGIAYAEALQSVLGQLRPMGGDLTNTRADIAAVPTPVPAAAVGGPNSGVIPYQWRSPTPFSPRQPRPVNIDRIAMKDYNHLTPHDQKLVRTAIRALEVGKAPLEPKTRALKGTFGVRLDEDARLLVYPHVDNTWHVFAVIPHHDYREAERRMGASGTGGIPPMYDPANAAFLNDHEKLQAAAFHTVNDAAQHYPSSWVDTSNSGKQFVIRRSETGRGFYAAKRNPEADDVLAFSNDVTSRQVAVHELAHRMEGLLPHVAATEWAFHWRRTSKMERMAADSQAREDLAAFVEDRRLARDIYQRDLAAARQAGDLERIPGFEQALRMIETDLGDAERELAAMDAGLPFLGEREDIAPLTELVPHGGFEDNEHARPDKYVNPYSGKNYGDGPSDNYEVLSMGMEGLFTNSWNIWDDPDYRHLVAGLLATG